MLTKTPFRIAKLQALRSASKFRIGCVLARGSRIISTGHNDMDKTHPETKKYSEYAHLHAEMSACLGLRPFDVKGCFAYVYRISANGSPAMAKPCEMCRQFLQRMGIEKVFYTTDAHPFWACDII